MDNQSISQTEQLAKVSRILGIISSVFLVLTIFLALWIRFSDFDEIRKLALFGWVVLTFLGNLITGIPGCVIAIIALSRNKVEGNDPHIKKTARLGLILSILGMAVAVIVFIFSWISSSNTPPPTITPPIPSTAIL